MKGDPELQMDDDSPDDRTYSPKRRRIGSDSNRLLPAIMIVLLVIILAGGISYFFTKRSTQGDGALQSKIASFEEKIMGLEKQIVDLQGKSVAGAPDPSLLHRVDALSQKVEALEKRSVLATELKKNLLRLSHRLRAKNDTIQFKKGRRCIGSANNMAPR